MARQTGLGAIALLAQANVLVAALTFCTSVMLARALGPDGRGVLANLVLWPTLICYPAVLGVHMELARRTAQDPTTARGHYGLGLRILIPSGLATLLIFAACALAYDALRGPLPHLALALAAGLMIPLGVWNVFQFQMELGRQNAQNVGLVRLLFAAANLAGVLLLYAASSHAVAPFLAVFLVASLISALGTAFFVNRSLGPAPATSPGATAGEVVWAARPFAVSSVLTIATSSLDRILVSAFFPARVMGLYVVALAISQIQEIVGDAISQLFFARTAQSQRLADVDKEWLALRLRQTMAVYGLLCLGTVAVAPVLLLVFFGERFRDSVSLVYLLLPALALKGATRPFEEVLKGGGRPLLQARIASAATAFFAVAGGLAAWQASLPMMLAALLLAAAGGLAATTLAVAREAGLRLDKVLVPRPADLTAMAASLAEALTTRLRRRA